MIIARTWKLSLFAVGVAAVLSACSSAEPIEGRKTTKSKVDGDRWQPPESSASGTYEGLNGEGCSGGLKPGTRALGDQIKQQFGVTYGGYSCRANTADKSQLSIHAVGRALDIMTSGASGDEIANHLVQNADTLGVQLIIWNRTLWKVTPNGPTSRAYTGPNPHTDHVHAEVNSAVAASGPGQVEPTGEQCQDPNDPSCQGQEPTGEQCQDPNDPNCQEDPWGGPGGQCQDPYDPNCGGDGWGEDDDGWYDEAECWTATDCDPSGQVMCDQGYCMWW